jgi:hypothetical protein
VEWATSQIDYIRVANLEKVLQGLELVVLGSQSNHARLPVVEEHVEFERVYHYRTQRKDSELKDSCFLSLEHHSQYFLDWESVQSYDVRSQKGSATHQD